MSQELINRSADLKRLRDDGYDIAITDGYLLLKRVPYVNARREIQYGTLVSKLRLAGDVTDRPDDHVAYFAGDHPCHMNGSEILGIKHGSEVKTLAPGVVVNHSFSNKPPNGYEDYHAKMTRYETIIAGPAEAIDANVTARVFPVVEAEEHESVFKYIDTASSRAGIATTTKKLELGKIAIVGLGGTGSYVLDLVAKTPVKEVHLFDGDQFSQHNAFRSPGAASVDELRRRPTKVAFLKDKYSAMRRGIVDHADYVGAATLGQLEGMDFVFLCLDRGAAKRIIVTKLEELGASFIDVGMGIELAGDALLGLIRTTTSTPASRLQFTANARIPFQNGGAENEYSTNIQTADLNALNAALAVIKWKKLYGFYVDLENEHNSTYITSGNELINDDQL